MSCHVDVRFPSFAAVCRRPAASGLDIRAAAELREFLTARGAPSSCSDERVETHEVARRFVMYRRLLARGIRVGYRRVVDGKPRLVLALCAEHVQFTFPGDNSFAGTWHGKQPLEQWLRRFGSLEPTFEIDDVLVA